MTPLTRRAVVATAAALAMPRRGRADEAAVAIENFTFTPATITVSAHSRVTWTNRDDIPHTVTSAATPRLFHSGPLDSGDSFSFVFDISGTFRYFCALHPHMQGTVVVT